MSRFRTVFGVALGLWVLSGCGRSAAPSLEDTSRAAAAYLELGSTAIYDLLSAAEQEKLRRFAAKYPELALSPEDMMYIRKPAPSISGAETKIKILSQGAGEASVETDGGRRLRMELVRENGRWRLKPPVTVHP